MRRAGAVALSISVHEGVNKAWSVATLVVLEMKVVWVVMERGTDGPVNGCMEGGKEGKCGYVFTCMYAVVCGGCDTRNRVML